MLVGKGEGVKGSWDFEPWVMEVIIAWTKWENQEKEKHIWRKMTFYFLRVEFKIMPEHQGGIIKQTKK